VGLNRVIIDEMSRKLRARFVSPVDLANESLRGILETQPSCGFWTSSPDRHHFHPDHGDSSSIDRPSR
jgi:hypothetical protein